MAMTTRQILAEFPAGAPRGSWPAEEFAAEQRRQGQPATVRQDIARDVFIVVPDGGEQ